ncbi:hypothetical protein EZV73_15685 [Acidaminobacter sp. JC074]|uniref:TadE/TadG family type IV pilus assembly protein n=1 Tax=Acidaminobacter sp. JC074 TaxID=2530199 RepID=UPI001F107644|nr:hypothetical protein [Acidaminobacter sp. JC074]MCH4889036.1 hypothetical protein [Acidaminobacter sp. JC074]
MFGNKRGSTTVESALIVPMMILIIVSFIMILLTTYLYGAGLLEELDAYIEDHHAIEFEGEIRGVLYEKTVKTTYKEVYLDARLLQDCVEYMIYQAKSYGHMLEKKDEQ